MSRMTAFRFTLEPTPAQEALLRTAGGAARLTYNTLLALVKERLDARRAGCEVLVPWSSFDLINAANQWKRAALAQEIDLTSGRPWHRAIPALVFEEAADGQEARARICSVTIRQHRSRWTAVVAVRAAELHPAGRHCGTAPPPVAAAAAQAPLASTLAGELQPEHEQAAAWAGVDVGLIDLVVVADQEGSERARVPALKYHRRRLEGLRRRARAVSRTQRGSRNHRKARARMARYQARTAAMREHHLHQVSNRLVKSHARLVIEDLNVKGMLANHHLAASIADASFGTLGRMLAYKADWHGTRLVVADRWFPSSKTCSGCGQRRRTLPLAERIFTCDACGLELDRDLNAAINLARYGRDLERLDREPSPDPGPASGRPG